MNELEKLLERMRRIEALYARTDVAGERQAAGQALDAILDQIRRCQATDPAVEYKFSLADSWSRKLFVALAKRYNLEPFRYSGQRHTTIMLRVSKSFLDETLWPEFTELSSLLRSHLEQVTDQVIAQSLHMNSTDETVVKSSHGALPSPQSQASTQK